jgi:alpha-tubulin suppressor-like RCC1 family protein
VACVPGAARCADPRQRTVCLEGSRWSSRVACPEHRSHCALGLCLPQTALSLGGAHACAQSRDGLLRCWGANEAGQLGLFDTETRGAAPPARVLEPVALLGSKVLSVAAGAVHTCAIPDDKSVHCWGSNGRGQLGLGDVVSRGDRQESVDTAVDLGTGARAVQLSLGARHSCALLAASGRVKCWGDNSFGQLGLGDSNSRGDDPFEMADALLEVQTGEDMAVVEIAAGGYFTCARFADGRVKCWGSNNDGELGLDASPENRGDQPGEMGASLPFVDLGDDRRAVALSAGFQSACALLDDQTIHCWGTLSKYLNLDIEAGPALALSVGSTHVCALSEDRAVRCWGTNLYGALGTGDMLSRRRTADAAAVDFGSIDGRPVRADDIRASVDFSCAVLETGEVACWGIGSRGQLGVFATDPRGDDPDELGEALERVRLNPD